MKIPTLALGAALTLLLSIPLQAQEPAKRKYGSGGLGGFMRIPGRETRPVQPASEPRQSPTAETAAVSTSQDPGESATQAQAQAQAPDPYAAFMNCYRKLHDFSEDFKTYGSRRPAIFTVGWIGRFHLLSIYGDDQDPPFRHVLPIYQPADGTRPASILAVTEKGGFRYPASPSDGAAVGTRGNYKFRIGVPIGAAIEGVTLHLEEHRNREGRQMEPTTLGFEADHPEKKEKLVPTRGTPFGDNAEVARAVAEQLKLTWDDWAKEIGGYFERGDFTNDGPMAKLAPEGNFAWLKRQAGNLIGNHTPPPMLPRPPPSQKELDDNLPFFQEQLRDALAACKESEWAKASVEEFERKVASKLPLLATKVVTSQPVTAGGDGSSRVAP